MKVTPMRLAPFLMFSAVAAVAGPAAAQPSRNAPPQCFSQRDIRNYAAQDDYTVNLRIGPRVVYQAKTVIGCPDIGYGAAIGYRSNSEFVCSELDLTLVTRTNRGPRECPLKSIRRLTPTEVAALPKRARP